MSRKRFVPGILSLVLAVIASALMVRWGVQEPPLDWRQVTINGFASGVTREQLEARLGPAHVESTSYEYGGINELVGRPSQSAHPECYRLSFENGRVSLDHDKIGFSLHGDSLEYHGRVIAQIPHLVMARPGGRDYLHSIQLEGTRSSMREVRGHLGGEEQSVGPGYFRELRYPENKESCDHELIITSTKCDDFIDFSPDAGKFELRWR